MLKKLVVLAAMSLAAATAFAANLQDVKDSYVLKDGSTVYVFKNGKMAMEDKLGRAVRMKQGHVMETKDGQRLIMIGDEVARLEQFKHKSGQ